MSRNTIIAIAAAVVAGGIVLSVSRRSRRTNGQSGPDPLKGLKKSRPHGGRKVKRADPHRDGHATPAGGEGRPKGSPAFFKA